jgi:hypothetical protein
MVQRARVGGGSETHDPARTRPALSRQDAGAPGPRGFARAHLDSTSQRRPLKSEIRNPKAERRPKSEIRLAKLLCPPVRAGDPARSGSISASRGARAGFSDFGFRPSFGLRISGFGLPVSGCPKRWYWQDAPDSGGVKKKYLRRTGLGLRLAASSAGACLVLRVARRC